MEEDLLVPSVVQVRISRRDVGARGGVTHFIDLYFHASLTCKDIKSVLLFQSSTNQDNNASKMEFATLATFAKKKKPKKQTMWIILCYCFLNM